MEPTIPSMISAITPMPLLFLRRAAVRPGIKPTTIQQTTQPIEKTDQAVWNADLILNPRHKFKGCTNEN